MAGFVVFSVFLIASYACVMAAAWIRSSRGDPRVVALALIVPVLGLPSLIAAISSDRKIENIDDELFGHDTGQAGEIAAMPDVEACMAARPVANVIAASEIGEKRKAVSARALDRDIVRSYAALSTALSDEDPDVCHYVSAAKAQVRSAVRGDILGAIGSADYTGIGDALNIAESSGVFSRAELSAYSHMAAEAVRKDVSAQSAYAKAVAARLLGDYAGVRSLWGRLSDVAGERLSVETAKAAYGVGDTATLKSALSRLSRIGGLSEASIDTLRWFGYEYRKQA